MPFTCESGPQKDILCNPNSPRLSKVPPVLLGRLSLPIQLPSIQTCTSNLGVHEGAEAFACYSKTMRDSFDYLPRWLSGPIIVHKSAVQDHQLFIELFQGLGFIINIVKSFLSSAREFSWVSHWTLSLPRYRIRSLGRDCADLLQTPSPSVKEISRVLGKMTALIQAIFLGLLHYYHIQADKIKAFSQCVSYEALVVFSIQATKSSNGGGRHRAMEWQDSSWISTGLGDSDWCLDPWLGGLLQWSVNRVSLGWCWETDAHKLYGAPRQSICNPVLHSGACSTQCHIKDGQLIYIII